MICLSVQCSVILRSIPQFYVAVRQSMIRSMCILFLLLCGTLRSCTVITYKIQPFTSLYSLFRQCTVLLFLL